MGKFSDAPYHILEDFLAKQEIYGTTYTNSARLVGGMKGIVAENSFGFDLYLKTEYKYYRINVQNVGNPSNNFFTFKVSTGRYIDSELTIEQLREYVGYEIYFRKEGVFYDFIDNYTPTDSLNPNINTNKYYSYFGKLYTTNNDEIIVSYDGYNVYVNNIIPENNRNDLLSEFINVAFDKAYASQHNLYKNILTLSDPKEVNTNYLEYLAKFYRMTIPESLSDAKKREYVAALPELLKRKGTYASFYIIWKIITSDTTNYLNIYERWHDWPLVGTPLANFRDVLYYWNPNYKKSPPVGGAGFVYYYDGQSAIYTTYVPTAAESWKIVHNLSNKYPFVQIINTNNEHINPYSIHYNESNYLTVKFDNLLPADSAAGRALTFLSVDSDNFYTEEFTTPTTTWPINHLLGTVNGGDGKYQWPLVQVIDSNDEMIIPGNIEFTDTDNLTITFPEPVSGRVIVGIPIESYLHTQSVSASTWTIEHPLNTLNVMVQVIDDNNEMVDPGNIIIVDENTVRITFSTLPDDVAGVATLFSSEGAIPYPIYEQGESMLSPHYLMEIDLTNEPFGDDYIINKALIDELINRWEEIRPVCKYSHYQEVIAPYTDFSGKDIQLYYNTKNTGYLYTRCCQPVGTSLMPEVSLYRTLVNRQVWTFAHNLDSTETIIQCFDLDQKMIVPKNISSWDSNIKIIEWEAGQTGYAYASKPTLKEQFASNAIWTMTHNLGLAQANGMLIQQTQYDNSNVFIPLTVEVVDDNTMTFTMGLASQGYASVIVGSYAASASQELTEWTINHGLDTEHIQAQFYDESLKVIYPYNVQILNETSIKAYFNELVMPRVVIKKIGLQRDDILDRWTALENGYAKVGTSGSIIWDPILNNDLENSLPEIYTIKRVEGDQYYVKIIINTNESLSIKEVGLFDNTGNIMFYSRCNEIYKPANVNLIIWYRIEKTVA